MNCDGQWGAICGDYFSPDAAHLMCRQLGYTSAQSYNNGSRKYSTCVLLSNPLIPTSPRLLSSPASSSPSPFSPSFAYGYPIWSANLYCSLKPTDICLGSCTTCPGVKPRLCGVVLYVQCGMGIN